MNTRITNLKLSLIITFSALIVLLISVWGRDFCFLADDYYILSEVYNPIKGFLLSDLNRVLSRVPLHAVFNWSLFNFGIINDSNWVGIYAMFALHCLIISQYAMYFNKVLNNKTMTPLFFVLASCVVAFFPNTYEILYWPSAINYIFGAGLLLLGLNAPNLWLKAFLFLASYLTSEMFILPSLVILLLPQVRQIDIKTAIRQIGYWLGVVLVFLIIRYLINIIFGGTENRIALDFNIMLGNLTFLIERTIFIHFYKLFYPISAVFVLCVGVAIGKSLRAKWIRPQTLLLIGLLIIGASSIVLPLNYKAVRALFGAQVFTMGLGIVGLSHFLEKNKKWGYGILSILFLVFFVQNQLVFKTKHENHQLIIQKKEALKNQIENCQEPCTILLKDLGEGLKRDWVLHPDYWIYFANYVNYKYYPERNVQFTIESETNL